MAGGRHIDDYRLSACGEEIKDLENGKDLVHAWRNDVEQCGNHLVLEGKLNVKPALLDLQRLRELPLKTFAPAAIFGRRVEFACDEFSILKHRNRLGADLLHEGVIKRRRGIRGTDQNRRAFMSLAQRESESRRNCRLSHAALSQSEGQFRCVARPLSSNEFRRSTFFRRWSEKGCRPHLLAVKEVLRKRFQSCESEDWSTRIFANF